MTELKDCVFHYTGARELISIVTKRELWATHTDYLNDRFDGKLPWRALKKVTGEDEGDRPSPHYFGENPEPRYVDAFRWSLRSARGTVAVSFSKDHNSLPQFRLYGPEGGGYAIGFPRTFLEGIGDLVDCDYTPQGLSNWCRSYIAEYWTALRAIDDGQMNGQGLNNRLVQSTDLILRRDFAGMKYKSEDFSSEHEVRLFRSEFCREFRPSHGGNLMLPYHRIALPNEPIEVFIIAGPNREPELAAKCMYDLAAATREAGGKWQFKPMGPEQSGFRW